MQVRITKTFRAVDPAGTSIHPRAMAVGEIVDGHLAVIALSIGHGEELALPPAAPSMAEVVASSSAPSAGAVGMAAAAGIAAAAAAPRAPAPAPRRAKLSKLHVEDGVKFAKGAIVEGPEADRLIGLGVAAEIKDLSGPAERK